MSATPEDRFQDLELKAEVWLARERVALDTLVRLQSGETLPLERDPDGPCELVINGSTVATGELLVVDGRFAFRVTAHDEEKLDQARQDAAADAEAAGEPAAAGDDATDETPTDGDEQAKEEEKS